jgi:hypothetical protein
VKSTPPRAMVNSKLSTEGVSAVLDVGLKIQMDLDAMNLDSPRDLLLFFHMNGVLVKVTFDRFRQARSEPGCTQCAGGSCSANIRQLGDAFRPDAINSFAPRLGVYSHLCNKFPHYRVIGGRCDSAHVRLNLGDKAENGGNFVEHVCRVHFATLCSQDVLPFILSLCDVQCSLGCKIAGHCSCKATSGCKQSNKSRRPGALLRSIKPKPPVQTRHRMRQRSYARTKWIKQHA